MFRVKGGGAHQPGHGNASQGSRKRLHPGMSDGAKEHVQSEVANQPTQGHRVNQEEQNHQSPKADHFNRVQDEETDGVRGLMAMVKPMKEPVKRWPVGQPVKNIHSKIHRQKHGKTIEHGSPKAGRADRDDIIGPQKPATDRDAGIQDHGGQGGDDIDGAKGLPTIKKTLAGEPSSEPPAKEDGTGENPAIRRKKKQPSLGQ